MKNIIKLGFALSALAFIVSCAPQAKYQDVNQNKLGINFTVTDQKNLIEQLSLKLVNDGMLRSDIGNNRPALLVDIIKNKTSEHIDTESITDTLKSQMIRARLFSVINRDKMDVLMKEQQINQSGLNDSQKATQLGKLWGVKYILYGNFSSIVNYVGKQKQVYYKLTLIIQDVETGQEMWIEEADLNKVQ